MRFLTAARFIVSLLAPLPPVAPSAEEAAAEPDEDAAAPRELILYSSCRQSMYTNVVGGEEQIRFIHRQNNESI